MRKLLHLVADREHAGYPLKPSIGRISFWIAFWLAIYLGITKGDVPAGVQWLIGTLLTYCGVSKMIAKPAPTPTTTEPTKPGN